MNALIEYKIWYKTRLNIISLTRFNNFTTLAICQYTWVSAGQKCIDIGVTNYFFGRCSVNKQEQSMSNGFKHMFLLREEITTYEISDNTMSLHCDTKWKPGFSIMNLLQSATKLDLLYRIALLLSLSLSLFVSFGKLKAYTLPQIKTHFGNRCFSWPSGSCILFLQKDIRHFNYCWVFCSSSFASVGSCSIAIETKHTMIKNQALGGGKYKPISN